MRLLKRKPKLSMKRLKGNIKTVTPKNVTNGMSVLHFCNTWEILIIDCIANGVLYFTGKTDGLSISEVRILVVEYNIVGNNKPVPDDYVTSEEFYYQSNAYRDGLKQIVLAQSEWDSAIKNKLVNADKQIDFTITSPQISQSIDKISFPNQAILLKSLDVYDDMRKIGLTSDQSSEVSDYIEEHFVSKDDKANTPSKLYDERDMISAFCGGFERGKTWTKISAMEFPHVSGNWLKQYKESKIK